MTIRSRWSVLVLLAAVLASSACGGSSDGGSAADAPPDQAPSPAAQPATTSSEVSVEEAAQDYLAAANKTNARLSPIVGRLESAIKANDGESFSAALNEFAQENISFQKVLVRIKFPAAIQPAADELTRAVGRQAAAAERWAGEPNLPASVSEFSQAKADTGSATQIIRARLGLPPPPSV